MYSTCAKTCDLQDDTSIVILEFADEITSCENMFNYLTNIIAIDLSLFDASKVTSMKEMFYYCSSLTSINFGNINTSSVKNMEGLFHLCINLTTIDVSKFDTSSVTSMNRMFRECNSLTSLDASNFNTENLEEMYDLFAYDRQLVYVNISSFYTPKVINMQGIFYCCEKIKYLDLHNFDGSSLTNFKYVFGYLKNVKYINLRKFKIADIKSDMLNETFIEIYSSVKYCIEDSDTKTFLIGSKESKCSELCFQKNIKVDMDQVTCECNDYFKNEFLVKCYDECPGNNQTIDTDNKYICEGPVPENYYLDEDEMYRKCYISCQTCTQAGNETNNNCNKCIDGYRFLNDSSAQTQNCYLDCEFYYYFNETNQYICTQSDSCPQNYKNLITPRKKCIDDCKKDDFNEYLYEYNNTCLKECPQETKNYEEEKLCLDECYNYQFEYKNICYNECPEDTYRLFRNRNICIDTVPENYYLDNNDNIYKECYNTCKKCSQSGNETNNNCDECINNYVLINDSYVPFNNCYPKCEYYYYFNESNEYTCTQSESCISNYKNIIIERKKCIDECKKDDEYIYEYNNTCFKECPDETKNYEEEKLCLDQCYNYQFEYMNICYNECPDTTHRIFRNRNICVDIIPENYYLDNNDNIYKECYNTCKKCSQAGNETNNNCDECINNYIFLNESSVPLKNCYQECNDLYYFNEDNYYICTKSCPSEYNKRIIAKNKCIDNCKNDDKYIYEYNNICLEECPEDKTVDDEEKKCLEPFKESQIEFNSISYSGIIKINENDNFIQKGNISIKNTSEFEELLNNKLLSEYIPEEGNSLLIETDDNIIYEITNSKNELEMLKNISNNPLNKPIIDLGECETILRNVYHINENDSLIFVKSEIKSDKASEKNVQFEVYEPYNKTKLNLSLCDETPINILIPMELSEETKQLYEQMKESGYDMFDINSEFYQDICTPFDSPEGTDILLSDRVDYIYNNENTQCQPNCHLSFYSVESHYMNCTCYTNNDKTDENYERKEKFTAKKIYESFYEVLKYSNYDIIKCFNIINDIKIITTNIGSIMVIVYFCCHLVCIVFYIVLGITPLTIKFKDALKNDMDNNNLVLKFNYQNLLSPPIRKSVGKKLLLKVDIEQKNKRIIENRRKTNIQTKNNNNDNIVIFSNIASCKDILDISPKNLKTKDELNIIKKDIISKEDVKSKHTKKETENNQVKVYSDFELNELEYLEAIQLDKRTFLQTYWATLKREHLIIFTFINCDDYNLLVIKLSRFVFLIATDMALNVFFFSDASMHKLYLNYGKYDFFQQIPQITYSTIISQLIEVFLCFLSLTDKYFYLLKTRLIEGNKNQIHQILKCMNIKLIIFYVFTSIFFFGYWYIVSIFCGVYRNTQIHFIKDSALSFSICLVYPFILYFISTGLRILSLRYSHKRFKCIYDFSYIIPFF